MVEKKLIKNELCFVVLASETYYDYIPLYIYFATTAYPDSFVRVYARGERNEKLLEQISRITSSNNWTVIFNHARGFPDNRDVNAALRFLIFDEVLKSFTYVYTGDIDILIAKEKESLVSQHVEHSNFIGLPYSNVIRYHSKRLTGLHFVKTSEYYDRVLPYLKKYQGVVRTSEFKNEEILYALCKDAGMLPDKEAIPNLSVDESSYNTQTYWFRPHHGLHLRAFRGSTALDDGAVACKHSRAYAGYLKAFYEAYNENVALLVKELNLTIQEQIGKALACFYQIQS